MFLVQNIVLFEKQLNNLGTNISKIVPKLSQMGAQNGPGPSRALKGHEVICSHMVSEFWSDFGFFVSVIRFRAGPELKET